MGRLARTWLAGLLALLPLVVTLSLLAWLFGLAVRFIGPESLVEPDPMGYRVHQWSPTDAGVAGHSSAIGARKPETRQNGLV